VDVNDLIATNATLL